MRTVLEIKESSTFVPYLSVNVLAKLHIKTSILHPGSTYPINTPKMSASFCLLKIYQDFMPSQRSVSTLNAARH